jgi:hypothetical protein
MDTMQSPQSGEGGARAHVLWGSCRGGSARSLLGKSPRVKVTTKAFPQPLSDGGGAFHNPTRILLGFVGDERPAVSKRDCDLFGHCRPANDIANPRRHE